MTRVADEPKPSAGAREDWATITTIPIDELVENRGNPRRSMNGPALEELVASVRAHGVLQPILVRPVAAKPPHATAFEVVAGHRRLAAARKAGLTALPALVRELDDKEALEVAVIENLQRTDLHPLEEADGYRQLIERHGYDVEQLAARVGKSKGYIYARIKLGALVKGPRAAFLEGKLEASTALLIARMPAGLQEKATTEILTAGFFEDQDEEGQRVLEEKEPLSYRAAAAHLRRNYMLRLAAAPFDVKDAALLPQAGACGACPKRSGNQPELFGDVRGADVCTDPTCYAKKVEASFRRRSAEAKAEGRRVIEGAEAKKIFDRWDPNRLSHDAPYVDLAATSYEGAKPRTYRALLAKGLEPGHVVVARDPEGGIHELVEKKALPELFKAAGIRGREKPIAMRKDPQLAAARKKQQLQKAIGRAMVLALLEKAKAAKPETLFPVIAASILDHSWHDVCAEVCKRREIPLERGYQPGRALQKWLDGQPAGERAAATAALVFECVITRGMPGEWRGVGPEMVAAARILKVDLKAIAARARAAKSPARAPGRRAAARPAPERTRRAS